MLRDPSEAAWHWQTSKTEHSAASSSAGSGFGGGSHDARVPQRGDAVCAAEHLDVVELTLKNDVRRRIGTCWVLMFSSVTCAHGSGRQPAQLYGLALLTLRVLTMPLRGGLGTELAKVSGVFTACCPSTSAGVGIVSITC